MGANKHQPMTKSARKPARHNVAKCLHIRYRGYDLPLDRVLEIGRSPACHLRVNSALVSRRHARITPTSDGAVIEDSRSRNGVIVNDRRIRRQTVLQHGDRITIGVETLHVFAAGEPPSAHTSTMPPGDIPLGLSDVDGNDALTEIAHVGTLSKRELEVFELIARGYTQREVAQILHISAKTVESHRARIGTKLGCRTRAELVSYAVAAGLLQPEVWYVSSSTVGNE